MKNQYALALLLALCTPLQFVAANEGDASVVDIAREGRWSFDINLTSLHFGYDRSYNQFNPGVGVSYRWNDNVSFVAGFYKNSYSKLTVYAGAAWLPWEAFDQRLKMGMLAMLATGYEDEGGMEVTPVAGVAASFNLTEKDALRAFYIPEGISRGFAGLQYSRAFP